MVIIGDWPKKLIMLLLCHQWLAAEVFATPLTTQIAIEQRTLSPYQVQIERRFAQNQALIEHILRQLEHRALPRQLVLIPMLESSFDPNAVSPANAAGLWQLIPATATRFGLTVNSVNDQRFDTDASTEAALDYLEFLYDKFNQDLTLTLAAYNAGEGRLQRAIKQARSTQFERLSLPRETVIYVSRFHALHALVGVPTAQSSPLFPAVSPLINLAPLAPLISL